MARPVFHGRVAAALFVLGALTASVGCDGSADPSEVTFFVTSRGSGDAGGRLGGLAGADSFCTTLAEEAGFTGHTWHAYLSTENVDARARIGPGPWINVEGDTMAESVDELHDEGIPVGYLLTEEGIGVARQEHDILTGSNRDGTFDVDGQNCQNYTSNDPEDMCIVGHTDGSRDIWNNAHAAPCDPLGMAGQSGAGRLYCFGL